MAVSTNDKIKNSLDKYNKGLNKKLDKKFVAQVEGKGLSTNDFTTAEKNKLANLENADTSNFVEKVQGKDLSSNDFTDELKTKLEGLENISTENFVVKVEGKGLSTNDFTTADKNKLDSLSTDTSTFEIFIGDTAPTFANGIWFDNSKTETGEE